MAEFKKNNRFNSSSSRPSFGNRNSSGPSRELFDTTCNKCGGRCQVPFRPNGKKPVYCTNCFSKADQQGPSNYAPKRDFNSNRAPSFTPAPQAPSRQIQDLEKKIDTMNATLEKLVTALDTFNRATALTNEIRKHVPVPAKKPAAAPVKKVAATKSIEKVIAKKVVKKVSKKAV